MCNYTFLYSPTCKHLSTSRSYSDVFSKNLRLSKRSKTLSFINTSSFKIDKTVSSFFNNSTTLFTSQNDGEITFSRI